MGRPTRVGVPLERLWGDQPQLAFPRRALGDQRQVGVPSEGLAWRSPWRGWLGRSHGKASDWRHGEPLGRPTTSCRSLREPMWRPTSGWRSRGEAMVGWLGGPMERLWRPTSGWRHGVTIHQLAFPQRGWLGGEAHIGVSMGRLWGD